MQRQWIGKSFCWICLLFPMLFMYSTWIPSITIADALLILWIIIVQIDIFSRNNIPIYRSQYTAIVLFVYIFIMLFLEILWGFSFSIVLKIVRYMLYFGAIAFFSKEYIDINYFWKIYRLLTIVLSSYLIVQALMWNVFHFKLMITIPFFQLTSNEMFQAVQYSASSINTFRPCSLFSEPAHFSAYVIGCLVLLIYREELKLSLFVSLAIALSSSGTGIICASIAWLIWFFIKYLPRIRLNKSIVIIFIVIAIVYLASTNSQVRFFISRTIATDSAILGRFSGYSIIAEELSEGSMINLILGSGMKDITEYSSFLPGVAQFILGFGVLGTFLLLIMVIKILNLHEKPRAIMALTLIFLSIGTMALVSYLVMIYFGFALSGGDLENERGSQKNLI